MPPAAAGRRSRRGRDARSPARQPTSPAVSASADGGWGMGVGDWEIPSSVVLGPWSLVLGRSLVVGPWSLVLGRWSLVGRPWSLVLGRSSLVVGPWSVVLGRSSVTIR